VAADAQIKITADTSQAERALGSLNNSLKALAGVVIGTGLFRFVDDLQNMQNKLRIAARSNDEFNKSMSFVKAIADSTGQSLTAIGDLYSRVASNADKLGYNTDQVATVTNAFATALKASAASAQGSSAALYQFGQILNKGKVNGDEFTTMTENLSGPVMGLLAKNMGLTTAELIKYKEKGLISAKDFTDALIRSTDELNSMQGRTLPTLGQSLQRITNAMGDFVVKVDRATGITDMLARGMTWLSKNVDTVLPLIAAFVGAFAATRLLAAVAALYEMVKVIRAVGIAAAVAGALASGGVTALTALAGAAAAYGASKLLFDKVDESIQQMNVDLKESGVAAKQGLGETNTQLSGIGEKLKTILDDLDQQISLGAMSERQYKIENEILGRNKDLQYSLTESQKTELRTRLQKLEILKAEREFLTIIDDLYNGVAVSLQQNTIQSRVQAEYERQKTQYGKEFADSKREELKIAITQNVKAEQYGRIVRETTASYNAIVDYQNNINNLSVNELELRQQILRIEQETGITVASGFKDLMARTQSYKQQLEYVKQIKSATEALNVPLIGKGAGAAAAGQLGGLDPVKAAATANETLFNGLKYLRDQDLISEQQYNTARVSATIQAQQAMYDATKKRFENEKLLQIQQRTGTQFGFETQKQMAQQAADFEKKSSQEKYAFALDQAAQMYSSLGTYNRQAFEAAKAFNIANAIMNTYMGATKALATYPPPFNFIAAAATVAMGLAQVSAIRSQSYSGRALGGPVMGGNPYIVGENGPELFTPNTTGSITRNDQLGMGGVTNINFTIQANDAQGFDDLLVQRRGMITQMVSDAMVERGQRAL
jgi:tape measure domain-containing protein